MKIDFVKTLEASSPYTPGRIYFEESTSLIKVATANNQYRVFGGVRSADYDATTQTLTIQNGNGDEVYLDMSEYVKQDSIIYNGNAKIFYGTCSTAAATTQKDVVCSSFTADDLVKGALIFVTFDNTNSGAVDSLTMSVNGTTAKPLKKEYTAALANLSAKGEILANQTYLFAYDGTNWVCQTLDYNTNTNTYQRVYNSSDNTEYPITTRYATTSGSAYYAEYGRYSTGVTLNPSTNAITASKYIVTGGTASQFLKADGTVDSNSYITSSDIPAMTTDASVADWGYTKNALTGVSFNGVDASVTNGVASITATIPPDNVFIIPVTKSGTTYSTTVTKSEAREAIYANKLLFVRMVHNRMVMPLRSYDTEDYGDYYFYAVNQYYIYTINLVAGSSDGPLSCYYTESALPSAITESTVSGWGFTKNTGTLTGVKFNNTDATVTNGVASITATIPAAPGTLNTNNTTAQTISASESLSGTINLHKVAKTGTYSDLINAPLSMATSNVGSTWFPEYSYALGVNGSVGSTCLSTSGILKEGFSDWSWIQIRYSSGGTAITENLQDYLDKHCIYLDSSIRTGNIPVIKYDTNKGSLYWGIYNNVDMTASPGPTFAWNIPVVLTGTYGALYLGTEGITKEQFNDWSWLKISYYNSDIGTTVVENLDDRLPDAPTGLSQFIQSYLNTTTGKYEWAAVTTLTSNSSDWSWLRCAPASSWTLQDTLNGKQNTLVGSGTGQNIKTVNNNSLVGTGNISVGTLTGVSFNGASASVSNGVAAITATIPAAANNATITIQKGGTTVDSFTVNASANKSINIPNELPTVTASDNGKILRVVNGAWAADTTTTVYSGSNAPNNSTGINGDIYIQT